MNAVLSPNIPFRDTFDQVLARRGPAAVFTRNFEGELSIDPVRTRAAWQLLEGEPVYGVCHCLFRDQATGFVQYVLVTSPELCRTHFSADITRHADQPSALAALAALGSPPIQHG